ncbi:MAG: hypothetical protein EOO29_11490 [Comamonadaceae bacterium]|nr:MAG: hypothetical protein EOO29_11490 [Comamonadaceae bacterium]
MSRPDLTPDVRDDWLTGSQFARLQDQHDTLAHRTREAYAADGLDSLLNDVLRALLRLTAVVVVVLVCAAIAISAALYA